MSRIKVRRVKRRDADTDYEVQPTRKNRLLAIILKNNKNTIWKWVPFKADKFSLDGNTYYNNAEGVYVSKNKVLMAVYAEGVSIPISHSYIKSKKVKKEYTNPRTGKKEETWVTEINNLKFDSEIVDVLTNRKLADNFTRTKMDARGYATIVLLLVVTGLSCLIAYGVFA